MIDAHDIKDSVFVTNVRRVILRLEPRRLQAQKGEGVRLKGAVKFASLFTDLAVAGRCLAAAFARGFQDTSEVLERLLGHQRA